jgi:dipeptidase
MTVEQAMIFAHQRCRTATGALELITSLLEKYGFLSSCCGKYPGGGEALVIGDPNEAWDLEIFGVGNDWDPGSGEPGVIWAARRIPDDHVFVMPNYPRIRLLDLKDPKNYRASSNYKQFAIDRGWYDPDCGEPFIWQDAYTRLPSDWNLPRMWLLCQTFAPNYINKGFEKAWDTFSGGRGMMKDSYETIRATKFTAAYFPFSIKPEKKVSVRDIMGYVRSTMAGTYWDMTADRDWLVPDKNGRFTKSPLTTPFPNKHWRELLDITHHRTVAQSGYYAMISQLRGWLPDPIGGIYWFVVDNYKHSPFIPVYCGVQKISPLYQVYDPNRFDEKSARWVYDFADTMLQLEYQNAVKDLLAVRDPFESGIVSRQEEIEKKAVSLYKKNPVKSRKFITAYVEDLMETAVRKYRELRYTLITKYNN